MRNGTYREMQYAVRKQILEEKFSSTQGNMPTLFPFSILFFSGLYMTKHSSNTLARGAVLLSVTRWFSQCWVLDIETME